MNQAMKVLCLLVQLMLMAASTNALAAGIDTTDLNKLDDTDRRLQTLMELMDDPQLRERLKTRVSELPQAAPALSIDGSAQENGTQIAPILEKIRSRARQLDQARLFLPQFNEQWSGYWQATLTPVDTIRSMIYLVAFLFVGVGLEWLFRQTTRVALLRIELQTHETLRETLFASFQRLLYILGGLLVFALGAIGAFLSFDWQPGVESLVLSVLLFIVYARIWAAMSLFIIAPRVPELRLIPVANALALPLYYWSCLVIWLFIFCVVAVGSLEELNRIAAIPVLSHATTLLELAAALLCSAVLLLAVWHSCSLVRARCLRHNTLTPKVRRKINLTLRYMVIWVVVTLTLFLLGGEEPMWSVLILGAVPLMLNLLRSFADHLFDRAEHLFVVEDYDDNNSEPVNIAADDTSGMSEELEQPDESVTIEQLSSAKLEPWRPIVVRLLRILLLVTTVVAIATVWGFDFATMSQSGSLLGRLFRISADVLAAWLIADLIWVGASSAIDRRMDAYVPPVDGQAPGPEARMATLLPLARIFLVVLLTVIVIMTVLSSLGVNIAPLIAGAGVLGVALGFGTQSLVRDVVSGVFFLIDDAFRVGEYIEIENLRGTVESMSLRSLRVRHHRGAVHTIPFGELKALTNYSRDWVIMKLEFRVPFDTDLKLVKKIIKNVGVELKANEDYGDSILQTLKSQGVRRMEEFNMVIGVKFMAKPGEQWVIRRDAYQKVRDAFDANGLSFAERNVKVEVLGGGSLNEETRQAVVGAAQDAMENRLGPAKPIPDEP